MKADQARTQVVAALSRIAPEIDPADVDPAGDLREQADLDSMDFLELVARLSDTTGVPIPEDDYARLDSLDALVAYLAERAAPGVPS
jgi:acyl carrier protein